MSMIIQCDICEKTFDKTKTKLEQSEIKVKHKNTGKEKDFTLLYFRCPHCRKLYQILPMDETSKYYHKQLEDLAERYDKMNKRGAAIPQALRIKAFRLRNDLGKYYAKINRGYQGMPYQLGDESHVLDIIKIPGITGEEKPK